MVDADPILAPVDACVCTIPYVQYVPLAYRYKKMAIMAIIVIMAIMAIN